MPLQPPSHLGPREPSIRALAGIQPGASADSRRSRWAGSASGIRPATLISPRKRPRPDGLRQLSPQKRLIRKIHDKGAGRAEEPSRTRQSESPMTERHIHPHSEGPGRRKIHYQRAGARATQQRPEPPGPPREGLLRGTWSCGGDIATARHGTQGEEGRIPQLLPRPRLQPLTRASHGPNPMRSSIVEGTWEM